MGTVQVDTVVELRAQSAPHRGFAVLSASHAVTSHAATFYTAVTLLYLAMSLLVKLNIGGYKYVTSKTTLTSKGNNFFTALLGGQFPPVRDDNGFYFIDRKYCVHPGS